MRAALIDQYGGNPHLDKVAQPSLSQGQTLVKVKAAALNSLDLTFAAGHHQVRSAQFPYILALKVQ